MRNDTFQYQIREDGGRWEAGSFETYTYKFDRFFNRKNAEIALRILQDAYPEHQSPLPHYLADVAKYIKERVTAKDYLRDMVQQHKHLEKQLKQHLKRDLQ